MMKWGVTEQEELTMLYKHVPWLFDGPGNLLYVGANQQRPPHHAQTLVNRGWSCHLLEIFPGNVEHHRNTGLFDTITQGDIRTHELPKDGYDVAVWWHGCEHIPKADLSAALDNLEHAAPAIVLGCPHGHSPQGPEYGNQAEIHLWDVYPDDLMAYGYEVVSYACGGHRRHLLAWRRN